MLGLDWNKLSGYPAALCPRSKMRESIETSSIHLDLLSNLKRINSQLSNIAHPLLMRAQHQE